jgi:fatty acid desaturase
VGLPLTAGDVLTLPELQELRERSSLRGAGLVLHCWGTIAAAMAAYVLWPSAPMLVLAVAVIGSRQLGLAILMHEASHWLLFGSPRLNTLVGTWLCAHPLGQNMKAYRRQHHLHHRYTQQPDDPDLAIAAAFPVAPAAFWRDVLGWRRGPDMAPLTWRRVAGFAVANAVLLGGLAAAGHWELYLLLWLLPLATWYRMVARLRSVAEHAMVSDDGDPLRNSRTTAAGVLARAFLAPYWVNHHLEHHLLVFVPCWKLDRAHALLVAKGYRTRMELAPGYLAVFRRAAAGR